MYYSTIFQASYFIDVETRVNHDFLLFGNLMRIFEKPLGSRLGALNYQLGTRGKTI